MAIWLLCCTIIFCVATVNWPLVNDASLIHYVSFLIQHGFRPYREIVDPNMPGSYLIDWIVIHTLGGGARGSRLYDFLLLFLAAVAMLTIAWRRSRFAGLYAACLFALFHGRDGMAQVGQRDLAVAVGLLGTIAFASLLARRGNLLWALGFGLTVGAATTIKPYALFFVVFVIVLVPLLPHNGSRAKILLAGFVGLLIPFLVLIFYLHNLGIIRPFLFVLFTLDPLHAQLGYPGALFLVMWCLPPSLLAMSAFGLLAMSTVPPSGKNIERGLLMVGIAIGLFAYFAQLKGFPYHRYPLVACLLLFISLELTEATKFPRRPRLIGIAGLLFGSILAPLYMERALHSKWSNNMEVALERDLNAAGGVGLNSNIQCIDSISGCSRVLYDMGLVQSTGVMYDEFLFVPHPTAAILNERQRFLTALEDRKPTILVITPGLFPAGPQGDKKLLMWPEFNQFLANCYDGKIERFFPQGSPSEPGYRMYRAAFACRT
jgi:4-amino-4-deoxy-L-arabinose transferase-like glycosyltransferase